MSSFSPAVRSGVGLLIGIAGATGSGKTFSALRLARGLAGGDDSKIAFIDTEAGRALHYAAAEGEPPSANTFAFSHAELVAPFSPERYLALIEEADKAGFAVIVIDSFSHEWDGEGGVTEIHDELLDVQVERDREKNGQNAWWNESTVREKFSLTAWKTPKLRHKRLVSRLLQCRAHLVICMRAEDKMRIEQVKEAGRNGREFTKTQITAPKDMPLKDRWQPICEKRFPFELITSLVLTPEQPGVPVPLKLQEQHRPFVRVDSPLDEAAGAGLAAWARGAPARGAQPFSLGAASFSTQASETAGAAGANAPAGDSAISKHVGAWHADEPCVITTDDDMDETDWRRFGTAMVRLIERADTLGLAITWRELNTEGVLRCRSHFPAIAARIDAAVDTRSAGGISTPAREQGAPGADGPGPGAPSNSEVA